MNKVEIRQLVLAQLGNVAPEAELESLNPDAPLRDALDIDSMDFLNFVIGLHERSKADIPEIDYPKLSTVNGAVAYLAAKIGNH
jgi:acyl carrier protein